ncbi:FAD-dependent monooxygenase [Yinghuangia sp. ASG 101]|uniref:FAD-dependent monooxygenase n=1 Tax=Yinghuangia sp. ASG 101 TaxID=2896848 RepID=UPI001E3BFA0D|nr:FAD-dependent monooxygenase [Yinghuangia sp. ASG 101]UGQ12409.1 FAD-dependent monooxygenase [Yinghuangia sp. ASG 101]
MSPTVVIAGAGPTGLMLAHELALAGVRTVVLERSVRTGGSRALGFHARSLEAFDLRGLGDPIRAENPMPWPRTHFAFLWLDVEALDSREFILVHPQEKVEAQLAARGAELGVDLRRGHEVVSLAQTSDAVTVGVRGPDGTYELSADYLVGCDGGRGPVAGLAGFTFTGAQERHYGIMGDVEVVEGQEFAAGVYPGGLFGAIPLGPNILRLMTTEFGVEPPDDAEPVTSEELRASVRRVAGADIKFASEPTWLHRFDNATRQAEHYRVGRVLLAGDAAHPHFPSGAQGVNLGIQDAMNLGWKLAAVADGRAPEGLLDTYHAERHPVGRRACLNAEAQASLYHPIDRMGALRDFLGEMVALPSVARHLNDMVTGLDTRYDDILGDGDPDDHHPLLGRLIADAELTPVATGTSTATRITHTLHAGRGVLLDLTGGTSGTAAEAARHWTDRVNIVEAHPIPDIDASALLLRPDGYVAWASTTPDTPNGLANALTTWFGTPTPAAAVG